MPTLSPAVLRLTLAIAAAEDWELVHWDIIVQAFITADVEEQIYIRLCNGCGPWSGKIVKLRKTLYGTKHAGGAFHLHFVRVLKGLSFEQCVVDLCLFCLISKGRVCAVIATYVDYFIVTGGGDALS
ncbi:unnamed protein product [Discosporangium mesarthrocarpum]